MGRGRIAPALVVVFPEGTRGESNALRPFKKGPFVLAIGAQVPVLPVVLFGTMDIQRKGSLAVRRGTVHVHFLEEVPTAGMDYDDRDAVAAKCWERMAAVLESEHGVTSPRPRFRAAS